MGAPDGSGGRTRAGDCLTFAVMLLTAAAVRVWPGPSSVGGAAVGGVALGGVARGGVAVCVAAGARAGPCVGSGPRGAPSRGRLGWQFGWRGDASAGGTTRRALTPTRGHGSRAPATTKRRRPSQSEARACTPGPGGQCGRTPANARPATATLTLQENRTRAVVAGEKTAPAPRVVTLKTGTQSLDGTSLARARSWSG